MNEDVKQKALDIAVPMIAEFEGCRLRAYKDAVGVLDDRVRPHERRALRSGLDARASRPHAARRG